jgi:hypothetical protein
MSTKPQNANMNEFEKRTYGSARDIMTGAVIVIMAGFGAPWWFVLVYIAGNVVVDAVIAFRWWLRNKGLG